jgi:hypothetical protein
MMRVYADVAGLGKRYLIVLPFLTPTIASLWVGTVTPIPPGLARPLIESLECDAVMRNHDIDRVIEPPADGLIGYRRAVQLALSRAARGLPDATWASLRSEPAEALPSDPDWAGEIVHIDVQTSTVDTPPAELWRAAELVAGRRTGWSVQDRDPGNRQLRLRAPRRARGRAWIEITITPRDRGSRYTQRSIFFPSGIPGRVYWFFARPVHAARMRALAREVLGSAPA